MSLPTLYFPHPELSNAYGLLAAGGDLSQERLLLAYHFGIFPWYSEGQGILWWSPDPRCVLLPSALRVSKSMRSWMRKNPLRVTADHAFGQVIRHCQGVARKGQEGTWITPEMLQAYQHLHDQGYAHSVEVWEGDQLIGGLYGIRLGKVFFGESMFSHVTNASKLALISLVQQLRERNFTLIDCQQDTPHLRSMGAQLMPRHHFLAELRKNRLRDEEVGSWHDWFVR